MKRSPLQRSRSGLGVQEKQKLAHKSEKKKRKESTHAPIRKQVLENRAGGVCEGCGRHRPLDWAHLFGRGNQISEPLCSSPEFTAGLCRECHESIDQYRDTTLRLELQWEAVYRMAETLGYTITGDGPPLAIARGMERWVASQRYNGVQPKEGLDVTEEDARR